MCRIQPETYTLSSRWIGAGQSGRVAYSEATEFSSAVDALSRIIILIANTVAEQLQSLASFVLISLSQ